MRRARRIGGLVALAVGATLLAVCSSAESGAERASETRARVIVSFETDGGVVRTSLLPVAGSEAERQRGLMGRSTLPADGGMLFSFPAPTSQGFWMKDTTIPLSIAFWDAQRRVLAILDMPPCSSDPCAVYRPDAEYTTALEMRRGWFDRHGVSIGDRVELTAAPA